MSGRMARYSRGFYAQYAGESARSAENVLPHIVELLRPSSVVDVGCGIGTWLAVFRQLGVGFTLGIDGPYVERDQLRIPRERFLPADLRQAIVLPAGEPTRFDLAVSLEVAEHLPAACARGFVSSLVKLAPVVLFSAAIPGQGGDHHINEQWPTYWAQLFASFGFLTVDWLRARIWGNPNVEYYYAQNSLLFVDPQRLQQLPALRPFVVAPDDETLSKVHPRKWIEATDPRRLQLRHAIAGLPFAMKNMLAYRLDQLLRRR